MSPKKSCYNTRFTLPKQSQRSRSILEDGSTFLGLFWKDKTLSYNRRNRVNSTDPCFIVCLFNATSDSDITITVEINIMLAFSFIVLL